jgi:hypothetical protein
MINVQAASPGSYPQCIFLSHTTPLCFAVLHCAALPPPGVPQGEGAAGWYCEYLVAAEDLVNSLAEKFTVPLQVRGGQGGEGGGLERGPGRGGARQVGVCGTTQLQFWGGGRGGTAMHVVATTKCASPEGCHQLGLCTVVLLVHSCCEPMHIHPSWNVLHPVAMPCRCWPPSREVT